MAALKISIPDDQREWIATEVAAGKYESASDYVQELIRREQQARKSLQLALIDGERSGVSDRSVSEVAHQALVTAGTSLRADFGGPPTVPAC